MRRLYRKICIIAMCMVIITGANGCTIPYSADQPAESETVAEDTETTTEITEAVTETTEETSETKTDFQTADELVIAPYDGEAFVQLNDNVPEFTEDEKRSTEAFENYSELDSLGRCGAAFANICKEIMPTEERGEIGDVRPSGWHVVKYPDLIEDNYLYNRSHLIAFSLAGENANEKNLITGTRYLNQETMQIFELKVLDYVRSTDNHVLYRVTPVFEGDNLVATGVQMEAWSVEDKGEGICFNVFCYNVQPGIEIDYVTGDSSVSEESKDTAKESGETIEEKGETKESEAEDSSVILIGADTESTTEANSETKTVVSGEDEERTYILNTNSKKIHLPTCSSVNDMAEKNKQECESSISELKKKGYEPCGRCLAEYR